MFTYKLLENEYLYPDIGLHKAFGISIYTTDTNENLISVKDIFAERRKAEEFISLCSRNKVSPIHIMDIIEDYINT